MTAPIETKQVRVSPENHAQLHNLANHLKGTANDAVTHLLDKSTVRVHISDVQRARWTAQARAIGVSLPEFIVLRVEAAAEFGCDPGAMHQLLDHVHALTRAANLRVTPSPLPVIEPQPRNPRTP